MPPERRERQRQVALARWARGEPNPMAGRQHSEATRERMRQARLAFYAQLSPEERKAFGTKVSAGKRKAGA